MTTKGTDMRAKMRAAGIIPADERLATIADECATAFPRDRVSARKQLEAAVFADLGLMLQYFAWAQTEAAKRVLEEAYKRIRTGQTSSDTQEVRARAGSGQTAPDLQFANAAPTNSPEGDAAAGQRNHDTQSRSARSGPSPSERKVVTLSILDTFRTPLGQPYGDAERHDLESALRALPRKRADLVLHERLLVLLINGNQLPAKGKLRDHMSADEFAALKHAAEHLNENQ